MSTIFISYSSTDRSFADQLVTELEKYYSVWIDQGELSGGLAWETRIEQALAACKVCVVIVSEASNQSEWVARETIRAEQLGKPRVPMLLNDDLPLRLLNLHYVDFRAEFAGGFRDLLDALVKHIDPELLEDEKAKELIGEGVVACLQGDFLRGDSLIGQALVLKDDLARSVAEFWQKLQRDESTQFAHTHISQINILERAKPIGKSNLSLANIKPREVDVYKFALEIDTSPAILETINYVKYQLHETFPNPTQIVRDRKTSFRLVGHAWGLFDVNVTVYFRDGTIGSGRYPLALADHHSSLLDPQAQ